MSYVNQGIYGSPEQWTHFNTNTESQQYEIRGAYFTTGNFNQNNLKAGITAGVLSIGQENIDNTVSVWGINANCGLCNVSLEAIYNPKEEGETQDFNVEYEDVPLSVAPATAKPLFLTGVNAVQAYAVTILPNTAWQTGYGYTNVPITSFNYTHTVMMCYLGVCSAVNKSEVTQNPSVQFVPLGEYYATDDSGVYTNTINPTTHPVILSGFVVLQYGYPYKVGTTTHYQTRLSLTSEKISFALFDTYQDFSYLSTPTSIVKWDKEKTYPKAITLAQNHSSIGYSTCVFGQSIQLINKTALKTTATSSIQQVLSGQISYSFNAKIKDKGELFYYTIANSQNMFFGIDYGKLTKEEIYSQFAMLGFWFADTMDGAIRTFCGEEIDMYTDVPDEYYEHLFIPEFDANTITTGKYYKAKDPKAKEQPNYKWGDPHIDNKYNPEYKPTPVPPSPDTEIPSDKYIYNIYNNSQLLNNNYYTMTDTYVQLLKSWFRQMANPSGDFYDDKSDIPEGQTGYLYTTLTNELYKNFNGAYPEESMLSLMVFPFSISSNISSGTSIENNSYISVGNTTTAPRKWFGNTIPAVVGNKITGSSIIYKTSRPYTINRLFNDFRDFSPYTAMSLTIPWHGTVDLDVDIWYGHSLTVTFVVDIVTGQSVAVIERDGIPVDTISGSMGFPVNLTSVNMGDYVNRLINGTQSLQNQQLAIKQSNLAVVSSGMNVLANGVNTVVSAGTGNVLSVADSTMGLVNAGIGMTGQLNANENLRTQYQNNEYRFTHTRPSTSIISSASPNVSYGLENAIRINKRYPVTMPDYDSKVYAETVGYACLIQGKIGDLTGYSVFSNVYINDSNLNCTDTEKNMILDILKSGIYL